MNTFLRKYLTTARVSWRAALMGVLSLITVGMLGGCGGNPGEESGQVIVGLTDAPGDFIKYSVGVKSLTLTRDDGAVVSVLANSATVDFTQYTEMTEFFTVATLPSGRYVKATMTLDYSSASIQVEKGGVATDAVARDSGGNAISTLDVNVTLSNADSLVIAPGVPSHLALDFDLASSNSVDTSVSPPVVTVTPALVADVQLNDSRQHIVRGLLGSVNTIAGTFDLTLRPLFVAAGNFGSVQIYSDSNTIFDIDGQSYTASAGLSALSNQALNSWVLVLGHFNTATKHFEATEVHAGSSVAVNGRDVVTGVVLSRNGSHVITVNAGSIVRSDGTIIFNKNITADLTAVTTVTRQLDLPGTTYGNSAISVGQRVRLIGTLNVGVTNIAVSNLFAPRLLLTQISGTVVSDSAELVINLQRITGRPASLFSFAGTGTTVDTDADPANYQVNRGVLPGGLVAGTPVKVRGFVKAFGSAAPDFTATTITNLGAVPTALVVGFLPASATAFSTVSSTQINLNMLQTGAALLHHVSRLGVVTDLAGTTPIIKANTAGTGMFAINHNGTFTVYSSFSDFTAAVSGLISGGAKVRRVSAWGSYNNATQTHTANTVGVLLN